MDSNKLPHNMKYIQVYPFNVMYLLNYTLLLQLRFVDVLLCFYALHLMYSIGKIYSRVRVLRSKLKMNVFALNHVPRTP